MLETITKKQELLDMVIYPLIGEENYYKLENKIMDSDNIRKIFDLSEEELFDVLKNRKLSRTVKLLKELVVVYFEPQKGEDIILTSSKEVSEYITSYIRAKIGAEERENIMVLLLNSSNKLIHKELMFIGTIDQAAVYPREIIRLALLKNAKAIILINNHPDGSIIPYPEDKALSDKVDELSKDLGIRVYDHLITTPDNVYSMKFKAVLN